MNDLVQAVELAKEAARANRNGEALRMANQIIENFPHEMKAWSLRAYIYSRNKQHSLAISDLEKAIKLNSGEPSLYFDKGNEELALGSYEDAVADFTTALELSHRAGSEYYVEALHFLRAEALLQLGKKQEALADLSVVSDGYSSWTYKLRTKADLLAEATS